MKKIDLKNMTLLTNSFETKILTNFVDEDGEKMFLEVKGLSLDDLSYLIEVVPQKTILNFIEGFSEKDVDALNDYVVNSAQKSFSDLFYSVIAAGSQQFNEEETLKTLLTTPQALKAFKSIIRQTLPQTQEELEEVSETLDEIGKNKGKKMKAILNCFKDIAKIIISK